MSKIKKLIMVMFIFIIIVVVLLILLEFNKSGGNNSNNEIGDSGEDIENIINDQIQEVTDGDAFFTVRNCIQLYYDEMNNNNERFYGRNDNDEYEKIVDDNEINQSRYNLLSEKYIEDNNVTTANISKFIDEQEEKVVVIPLNMKVLKNVPMEKYIVYGFIENLEYKFISDFYIIVNLDVENRTFSIEPIREEYEDIDQINIENENQNIEENENNIYSPITLNYENTAKEYFSIYKRIILATPTLLYDYLDEEYKDKRFENFENFEQYVQENKEEISRTRVEGYTVNSYGEYTEYICQDQYNNIYTFDVSNPMKFSLKLDTYTIPTEEFKETYDTADVQEKVVINTNKWILMINNQDYDNAYNVLSEEFRANYFPNKQDFIEYIKENMYRYNKMEVTNFETRGNTYLCTIELTDLTEGAYVDETKGTGGSGYTFEWNIVMQLGDNYDFVMSFEVK